MSDESNETPGRTATLDREERRVLGVLIEKAKTTPDAYPLSLNALRTGCNQKSNRFPQMDLDDDRVETIADSLRAKGAITLVQGDSRVERFRHRAYDWFGVDKVELAVLAELLLRGAQSVGELRGRAARMEPIKGVSELTPVLASMQQKGLVEYLSPPGRGAVVSHRFYSENELARVRKDLGLGGGVATSPALQTPSAAPTETPPHATPEPATTSLATDAVAEVAALRVELSEQISQLRQELEDLKNQLGV